jgi:subtilase family serine protease
MIKLRSLPLYVLASVLLIPAFAQGQGVASAARILNRVDESQLVSLRGNTPRFANARHDQGRVADDLPMTDLILVLSRSAQQQAAFDAYVASEYDPNSPNFHKWLTPDQIGEQFGPSQTDILTITNWLTGHGLTVSEITRDRMSIRFSGSAAQVQSVFHTEIHNLNVNGQAHIGNMSDPQIPSALAPVVVGVKSLHNFFPKPLHRRGQTVQRDAASGQWARPAAVGAVSQAGADSTRPPLGAGQASRAPLPQFGISASSSGYPYLVEDVGPWDFATIYNIAPLWNAGIDGTGQTIAIAGTSAIDLGETSTQVTGANGNDDIRTFRTFFNLPTTNSWNTPIQVSGNSQPLTVCTDTTGTQLCGINDLLENSLDVEWSGSVAKNAQIVLVASYPASASDDNLYDSESYIVDNVGNPSSPVYGVHVMNVSYGACELSMGTAGNVQYYDLWQTAAAEGLAVFVASGDSGSASCDDGYNFADYGNTVSGIASTPFDTAVGGTDFNWCAPQNFFNSPNTECTASPYWNTSNNSTNQSSAKNYVPEVPWNDTCANPLALTWEQDIANEIYGISASSVSTPEQACNFIYDYSYTGYQGTVPGLGSTYPYGEYLLEVVGGSGGASSCVVNTTNPASSTLGSCTASTGAGSTGVTSNPDTGASQASVATYNNGWPKPSWQTGVTGIPTDGVRDVPDVSFFAADGFLSSSAYLVCVSQDTAGYGTGIQPCSYSSSVEPFAEEVGGTSVATPAMAGIMALINQKSGAAQGSPNQELYALAAKQTWSSTCTSENATTSDGCYFNDIDKGTNAMPCDYADRTPNCVASQSTLGSADQIGILSGYSAGTGYDEATGLGSLNVANVVNAWQSTTGSATANVIVRPSATTLNADNWLAVTVMVASNAVGGTAPTGGISLIATSGSGPALITLTGTLNSSGSYTFNIPPNTLSAGTDLLTANYGGDSTYGIASNSAQVTVSTSSLTAPTVTVTPTPASTDSNAALSVKVTITPASPTPTGTVSLSGGGYSSPVPWPALSGGSYTFTIPANTLSGTASGQADTLTATYSGDANYAANTGQNSVTVLESTFSLKPGSPSSSSVTPGQSATVSVAATAVNGYTGTVTLSCAQTSTTATGSDGTTCTGSGNGQVNLATCGNSCSVTFTIGTTAPVAAALARPKLPGGGNKGPGGELLGAGSGAVLALLVFFGIPARRRSWRNMLSVLIALAAIGIMTGCGGGSSGGGGGGGQGDPGTTAGTYTYTVTASANPSVTPTVTSTFTVTVN